MASYQREPDLSPETEKKRPHLHTDCVDKQVVSGGASDEQVQTGGASDEQVVKGGAIGDQVETDGWYDPHSTRARRRVPVSRSS